MTEPQKPRYLVAGPYPGPDELLVELRGLAERFGPANVALAAISLTDPNYVIARMFAADDYDTPFAVISDPRPPRVEGCAPGLLSRRPPGTP